MKKLVALVMGLMMMLMMVAGCGSDGPKKMVIGLDDNFAPMGYRNEKNEIVRPHIAHNQLSGIAEDKITCEPIYPKIPPARPNGYTIKIDGKEAFTFYYIQPNHPEKEKTTMYRYRADVFFQSKGYSLIVETDFPVVGDTIRPFVALAMKTNYDIDISNGILQILQVTSV